MIAMSTTMTLKGHITFSVKKLLAGGEMAHSIYMGPGEVLLAPSVLGDVMVLRVAGTEKWKLGRDAFLASTSGIKSDYVSQGLMKGVFSGEGLFVYEIKGNGLLWVQSFGAIIKKDVRLLPLHWTTLIINVQSATSLHQKKRTSSITATLWRGTASIRWSVLRQVASCPTSAQGKVSLASLQGLELSICKLEI